jgi:hypothetical protein
MQELIANEEQNPQKAHKNQEDDNMEEITSSFQAPLLIIIDHLHSPKIP